MSFEDKNIDDYVLEIYSTRTHLLDFLGTEYNSEKLLIDIKIELLELFKKMYKEILNPLNISSEKEESLTELIKEINGK